ncbi:hypothetical protein PM082_006163 [Marasmius tenuissimus]|nr:hypothetical protein PM082_006163 [Marasmius tenuissimus]
MGSIISSQQATAELTPPVSPESRKNSWGDSVGWPTMPLDEQNANSEFARHPEMRPKLMLADVICKPRSPSPDRWGDLPATPVTEASDASGVTGMTTRLEGAWMQSRAVHEAGLGYGRPWRDGWTWSGRNVLKYMCRNFGELGWSYHGSPHRDTSLDDLSNQEWCAVQLVCSLPAARNRCAPPPTFTGPQVEKRMTQCKSQIQSGDDEVTKLRSRVSDLKRRIRDLKQEIDDTETELHDIEDLIYNVNGKTQKEKEDLRLVALSWLEKSDVVPSLPLPSS